MTSNTSTGVVLNKIASQSRTQRVLELIGPPALFMLLSALFLWRPIVTGQVYLPTDLSYKYDYMWIGHEPPAGTKIDQNHTVSDVADQFYPYVTYAIERLRSGNFPLWNPYILTGTPFLASSQPAVLDPVNLITYLFGPFDYWTWAAWLRLAILGYTTYGFMRALGKSAAAGLAAGTVFMICGFVVVWLNYAMVWSLVWMPALFWASTRLLQTGRLPWLGLTAVATGAMLLGGHPETQFLCGLLSALYILYALFVFRVGAKQRWQGLSQAALAGLLGLGIGAAQLAPSLDYMISSGAFGSRSSPPLPFDPGETGLRLLALLFPNWTGTPLADTYWVRPGLTNFNEQTGYIGLLALGLGAIGAASMWRRDRLVAFFAVSSVLALLLAIRTPGFHLVRALPILSAGHGVRWLIIVAFFGAVLAGYGVEALMKQPPGTRKLRNSGLWLVSGALAAFGVMLAIYLGIRDLNWDRTWNPMLSHVDMARLLYPAQFANNWPLVFLGLGALVVLARWRGLIPAGALPVLLVAFLYADLWTFGHGYNPTTPRAAIMPPTQVTRYLVEHADHDRMAGTINLLRPNVAMVFGLRDLRGYEPVVDGTFAHLYEDFYHHLRTPVFDVQRKQDLELTAMEQRQLNIAGVRYIATVRKPRVDGSARPYTFILQEQRAALYENLEAFPRAYVVFGSRIEPNIDEATVALRSPELDPGRTVVLTAGEEVPAPPGLDRTTSPVTWRADEPERVELEVTLPQAGWLVLSDNFATGWEAMLDGNPAPLLRGNVAFRAVAVPAGTHRVSFHYRPRLFYVAATISSLSATVALALGLIHLTRRPNHAISTNN
ncbi:MAG: YfhO family protein [Chloroflexota bacterium]|nr:YfhO family protein [Chloroflexota bacterium]